MSGEGVHDDDFRDFAYNEIADNIQALFMQRDNDYIKTIAYFVAKFLEANAFVEIVYVDTLIHIVRKCEFTSEMIVRFRTLMELISPDVLKDNLEKVLNACKDKDNMRGYVKKELEIWVKQNYNGDSTLINQIRKQ